MRAKLADTAPPRDTPLVLKGNDGSRRVVTAADDMALRLGLRVGMTVSKAQALVPDLVVLKSDPVADNEGLHKLAVWGLTYSPVVAADAPDGLVIDTTGADHLHGGELALCMTLIENLNAMGVSAQIGMADSWGAAHALARFSRQQVTIAAPGEGTVSILDLPAAALRLDAETVQGLRHLGFDRIGELSAQPRAPLARRFGQELNRRLEQAFGRMFEPIEPVRAPDMVEVRRGFAEPISATETLERYIVKLVQNLCAALEERSLGARRLDLICHRVDNRLEVVRVGTAKPVRDVKRLTRLLTDKIETIDPGFGIELMRLTASLAEPLSPKQMVTTFGVRQDAELDGLVDLLINRLGAQNIYRFAPNESDVPERSVAHIPATADDRDQGWPLTWPRPARLLKNPEPIETMALLPDNPPISFTWRGERFRVRCADGPERIFGEWWLRDTELAAVRDYFRVEVEEGKRFWLYRAGDGEDAATGSQRWFLHGVFG